MDKNITLNNYETDKAIEEAIEYLVFLIQESGNNPKPVILHSIKVGINLYNHNYNKDIVIAAILHDIIEDAAVTKSKLEQKFGLKVANLIQANSFDPTIIDKIRGYKENFARCKKAGKEALIIKAADIYENADYCCSDSKGKINQWWMDKMKYFIDISEDDLRNEKLYKELSEKYNSKLESKGK